MYKILFLHENYPAQFGGLGEYLVGHGWDVMFGTARKNIPHNRIHKDENGIKVIGYHSSKEPEPNTHRHLKPVENAIINASNAANLCSRLERYGFTPDIVVAHSGWGSGSYVKAIWPNVKFVQYLEWWYQAPELTKVKSPSGSMEWNYDARARTFVENLPFWLDFQNAEKIIFPTKFQQSVAPKIIKDASVVMHDGIDTQFFSKRKAEELSFGALPPFDKRTQVLTYATRGMEPMRGFMQFMEALSLVQKTHPHVQTVIAGEDKVAYDQRFKNKNHSYLKKAFEQFELDNSRIYTPGRLPLSVYRDLLARSDAHVYLTKPFVLSWSLIQSMACEAPLIVSNNDPVREALPDDDMAQFVPLNRPDEIAEGIRFMLDNPGEAKQMARKARQAAVQRYSAKKLHRAHEKLFIKIVESDSEKS